MRIRKKQHKLLHGAAFLLTGGLSAPVSASMMGQKALNNRKADAEAERIIAAIQGQQPRRKSVVERLEELKQLQRDGLITDAEFKQRRWQIISGI